MLAVALGADEHGELVVAPSEVELVDLLLVASDAGVVGHIVEDDEGVPQFLVLGLLAQGRDLLVGRDDGVQLGRVEGVEEELLLVVVLVQHRLAELAHRDPSRVDEDARAEDVDPREARAAALGPVHVEEHGLNELRLAGARGPQQGDAHG
jgi:hypothetical protein